MNQKEKCEVAMLAYAFIDSSKQECLSIFGEILNSLSITFEQFAGVLKQMTVDENSRYLVYNDIKSLSSEDKGTVRSILFKAYSNGGKEGTEYALYYFKEMIEKCNLANVRLQL